MKSWVAGLCVLAWGLASVVASSRPAGAGYKNEVGAEFFKSAGSDHFEEMIFSLGGTRYFSEVKAEEGPLAEASFLERTGGVGATAAWYEENVDGHRGDGPGFGVGFTLSSPGIPVWGGLSYARSDVTFDTHVDVKMKAQDVFAQAGLWIATGLTAGVWYERYTRDMDNSGVSTSDTYDDVAGFGRWVWLVARENALALSASFTLSRFDLDGKTGTDQIVYASADYYFSRDFSLGVTGKVEQGDHDFLTGKTFGLRAEGFLTPEISVSASFEWFSPDTDQGSSNRQLVVGGRARF